ncbi:hypothetical protein [Streptomyces sp. NPDC102282]|uniref:hypothetical protein n=1 Tax=Streptomyces sp. NPDC102282 TaxID=3366154 RepID=UPI0037F387E5
MKLRTKVTRPACSPVSALAMMFKPLESARAGRRAFVAPHSGALVRDGVRFENCHLVERSEAGAAR